MICVQDKQSLNFVFGGCSVPVFYTVVFFALIHASRGQSEVIGLPQPIVAMVGDDIILPCHLDPVTNAFDMTVEWARPNLQPRFVLVWRDGVELESKHPSYMGRTSLFTDELKNGNISLKLSKVKLSDKGTYRCFVPGLISDSTVQLVVGAASSPVIQTTKNNSGVVLQCESKGWYPEPEVLWLDSEGNNLSAGPTETVRGPDDLYTVSSRVTVEKRHSNNITCRVQQRNINQTRETQINITDYFFIVSSTPSTPSTPSTNTGWAVAVTVFILLILAAVFVVWKWRQRKFKKKRKSNEDGTEQREEEKMIDSKSDDTKILIVTEAEEESVPLMAGREEENNVERGEINIKCQSEHKDSQFVTERETHQDQFVTKPELQKNMDRTEEEIKHTPVITENQPQISTGQETQRGQDMKERQEQNDRDKGEGEEMKRIEEDTGRQVSLAAEGQQQLVSLCKEKTNLTKRKEKKNTKSSNYHTDQEVQKPKLKTQKERRNTPGSRHQEHDMTGRQVQKDCDKGEGEKVMKRGKEDTGIQMSPTAEGQQLDTSLSKETNLDEREGKKNGKSLNFNSDQKTPKKENEQDKVKKIGLGLTGQKKEQEKQREQIQLEPERQKVENARTLQPDMQEGIEREKIELKKKNDNKPEGIKAELENKKEMDQGGNQRDITGIIERKAENQKEQINERLKETDKERLEDKRKQLERGMKVQKHNTELKSQNNNQHVLEDKQQEGNKAEPEDKNEKDHERETKEQQGVKDVTERTDVKMQQETTGKKNQESQAEKQPEEKSQRSLEEIFVFGKVESQERPQREMLKTNNTEETQRKVKEPEKLQFSQEGLLQAEHELDIKPLGSQEETTDQGRKYLKGRRVKCQKEQQEEPMEIDKRPDINESQRNVKRGQKQQQKNKIHMDQQKSVGKRKYELEDKTKDIFKKPDECLEGQDDQMDTGSEANTEKDDTAEPQRRRRKFYSDQSVMCQEDQQEQQMDVQ